MRNPEVVPRSFATFFGWSLLGFCLVGVAPFEPLSAQSAAIRPASLVDPRGPGIRSANRARAIVIEAAVSRGLAWLAEQQNERGFFGGIIGTKRRNGYYQLRSMEEQRRTGSGHIGVTAICGMAFLAGGHLPSRGKYKHVVRKAVSAVLSGMQENGMIILGGTRMYSHAFATLFLAEVYGMERDPKIKKGLERAVHIIVDCQNALGGWRYNAFARDADVSVTVCQLQALRAARNIGIQIPKSTIDRAANYVKECQVPSGMAKGRFYYSVHDRRAFRKSDHYSIQAAAVTSLVSAGIHDRELIEPALDFLAEDLPYMMQEYPHHFFFWYGNYYACQAFFHAERALGNQCFERYYDEMSQHLLEDQEADGRWLNPRGEGPGDEFGTAVACIVLQVPNQYLPIFQR